jgi:hypothetical protein
MFGSERDAKLSYLMNLQSKLKRRTVISTVNKNPRKTRLFGEKERFLGGFELKKQPLHQAILDVQTPGHGFSRAAEAS